MSTASNIRCRQIVEADQPGLTALLARGFPSRSTDYWARGLARLARREVPPGFPRFGYCLESGGTLVGALLMIVSVPGGAGQAGIRCNLSSWFVEPAVRNQAAMLGMMPFRSKGATFLNISPAPNTWATIEAQGFRRYTAGQMVALPALARSEPGLSVEPFGDGADLPEARLLADHAALGCLTLLGRSPGGLHPFVFLPFRAKQGRLRLPAMQLVYRRSLAEVVRFAGPLGRALALRGTPVLVTDADGPVPGLPGYFWKDRARKYFKGPDAPRLGDLAYTEFTIFGP